MPRREVLTASGGVMPAAGAAQDRAAAWLSAWDSQGIHRTATPGDEAGAAWLAGEVAALGAAVTSEEFALDRVEPHRAFLEVDGTRIPGTPLFDAPDTPRGGVEGLAGKPGSGAPVGLGEFSPHAVYTPDFRQLRESSRQRALVLITRGGAPGLALLNAEGSRAPYGPPALHVDSEAGEALLAAMARGAAFRVVCESRRVPAHARNVVATLPGRDPARAKTVVMTPRSSWWQSTAERGGGLVCWLETLRALIADPPAGEVIFTANSGHELGHIGLDDFLARRPGLDTTATWLHYGANIGAAGGTQTLQSAADDLRDLAGAELAGAGQAADAIAPKTRVPTGETRDIHLAGGRYLTLVGSNNLFHLPQDRWPGAVDVGIVARSAAALARVAVALTR